MLTTNPLITYVQMQSSSSNNAQGLFHLRSASDFILAHFPTSLIPQPKLTDSCPAMQSSSSNGAEGLFELRSAEDLILPADLDNPHDPKVFVVDPKSPEAWKVQVRQSLWPIARRLFHHQ